MSLFPDDPTLATPDREAEPDAKPAEPEPVDAVVSRVHVHKEDTGWTVMTVERAGMPESWVGVMPKLTEGMKVRATGEIEEGAKWGRQFRVHSLIVQMPSASDPDTLAAFLAKLVPGIGDRLAWRIVDTLGDETIAALENNPEKIATVRGVSLERARALCEEWGKHSIEGQLLLQLARYGLRGAIAKRVIKEYGGRAVEVCEKEPFLLSIEVDGIGWKTADSIAKAVGVPLDSITRMQAGVLHVCDEEVAGNGHCFTDQGKLLGASSELLKVGPAALLRGLEALEGRGRVVREGPRIYPAGLYHAEVRVAERVARLLTAPAILRRWQADPFDPLGNGVPEEELPASQQMADLAASAIEAFERRAGSPLAEAQRAAVHAAMSKKVLIVTGGPGVGKTTTTRAIIAALDGAGFDIALGAPTGRAAKRLAEATGRPAATIHRLLEYDPREGRFTRNATRRLEQTAIILDEVSMMSVDLAASFLEAVDDGARLILVGDVDQLPSVGPGAVLRDLIESEVLPVVRLTQIFRQAEGSRIVVNAHRVNQGQMPERGIQGPSDFYWIERTDPEMARATALRVITERLSARGIATRDMVVLSPQKTGACGVPVLNKVLQQALNPTGACVTVGKAPKETVYRVGDRVLQTKNDYERGVFNGDAGWVTVVDGEKSSLAADIDGREVLFERKHFEHLLHGYACTVHRMQGGQAKAVIIMMLREHIRMLSRQLLYTALTRGEQLVVLIADPEAVRIAVSETRREVRNTTLKERLRAACSAAAERAALVS